MDDDGHPLLVELASLRQSAARFQHEAHAAAIKLQRYSLESARIHEHAAALAQENARLAHELEILRAHPDVQQHPAIAQVQELSLALRRVSDKIVLTENALLERTSELAHARGELSRAKHAADDAYELTARMRAREEASKARERELEFQARASEEERKMVDLVVQEYADLVRNLEGRKSAHHTPSTSSESASTPTLSDTLQDDKFNLHKLLTAFSTESEDLHATIAELTAQVSHLRMTLDMERTAASHDRTLLAQAKTELDKLNLEDKTAAKMVARYMKFSQASTNALQQQITTLHTRHASTIATLEHQLSITESQLVSECTRAARLQDALDELCEDLARESYGRRREVALRLALVSREESIAEYMRRWARKARELYMRCYDSAQPPASHEDAVQDAFYRVVSDAESLLSTLDDDVYFSDGTRASGSLARITLSRAAVDALRSELQDEIQKRVEAIRKRALLLPNGHLDKNEDSTGPENTPSQADQLLLTPNGSAMLGDETQPAALPWLPDVDSPTSTVAEQTIDDPFVLPAPVTPPVAETMEHVIAQGISIHDSASASTSVTLLVEEELKSVQPYSPAVSVLDVQDLQSSSTEDPPITDIALLWPSDIPALEKPKAQSLSSPESVNTSPSATSVSDVHVSAADDIVISTTSKSTPGPAISHVADPPSPTNVTPTLLSELEATKGRYDALQRAFRDCSLALKDLKRTLASASPAPHVNATKFRQHLETALARIDDYAEDARVELEIRIADEELTARGFAVVLSVPDALADADPDERAQVEDDARAFVDGTDEGVMKALQKFGRKLEDVQHDVAVVKRAVHGLAMSDGESVDGEGDRDGREEDVGVEESKDAGGGPAWTAWTVGLLGATTTPTRSPTPVETFGAVMTSPRLRHAPSLKQLHALDSGLLASLNLRIPMPAAPSTHVPWAHLGLGRPAGGDSMRPRTLSAMYAVGGLRSSSVGLGVGLSGSPSPVRTRDVVTGRMGGALSPLRTRNGHVDDTRKTSDLGGVE